MDLNHIPVMVREVCEIFEASTRGGLFVDCTLGLGGHTKAILESNENNRVLGIDVDEDALNIACEKLKIFGERVKILRCNFKEIDRWKKELTMEPDGILLDLGISSLQLREGRGFSFNDSLSLDMRMDKSLSLNAKSFLERASQREIEEILKKYGEIKGAKKIASSIIELRKKGEIDNALELKNELEKVIPKKDKNKTLAQIFQAIRIYINKELEGLDDFIRKAVELLKSSGKIIVISYHSLEDRIVKRTFLELKRGCTCPKGIPACVCGKKALLSFITKKPIVPTIREVLENNSSRSAKLRYAVRI